MLKKLLGIKKKKNEAELAKAQFTEKAWAKLSQEEKNHVIASKGRVLMIVFEGTIKIGNALNIKDKIVKDDLRTKKITAFFAYGVIDGIAQLYNVSALDSMKCFEHYMSLKIKEDEDYLTVWKFVKKGLIRKDKKNKIFFKIVDKGAQAAVDFSNNNLKNKILLHSIIVDKKNILEI